MHLEPNSYVPAISPEPVKEIILQLAGKATGDLIRVTPTTTAKEILDRNVPEGRQVHLTSKPGQTPFAPTDRPYDSVADGATLYAIPAPTFGE